MAERDKSQGFGFVYVDVKKLLDEARARVTEAQGAEPKASKDAATPEAPPAPITWPTPGAKVLNFNRDAEAVPTLAVPDPASLQQNPGAALKQIRQSLDRLQALHHKLHAVLAELSQATERDRNKK